MGATSFLDTKTPDMKKYDNSDILILTLADTWQKFRVHNISRQSYENKMLWKLKMTYDKSKKAFLSQGFYSVFFIFFEMIEMIEMPLKIFLSTSITIKIIKQKFCKLPHSWHQVTPLTCHSDLGLSG